MGRPQWGRIDPRTAAAAQDPSDRSSPPPGQAVRRLCRQGRRHRRIPPRTNLQRGRPRYYFENLGKIFSPSLAGRSVEKMASDAGTPFKFLQSWTILLVGRQRGKNQGTGGFESCDARKQSRTGIRDDRGPRMIGPGRCIGLVADCGGWHRAQLNRLARTPAGHVRRGSEGPPRGDRPRRLARHEIGALGLHVASCRRTGLGPPHRFRHRGGLDEGGGPRATSASPSRRSPARRAAWCSPSGRWTTTPRRS